MTGEPRTNLGGDAARSAAIQGASAAPADSSVARKDQDGSPGQDFFKKPRPKHFAELQHTLSHRSPKKHRTEGFSRGLSLKGLRRWKTRTRGSVRFRQVFHDIGPEIGVGGEGRDETHPVGKTRATGANLLGHLAPMPDHCDLIQQLIVDPPGHLEPLPLF